jgi:hypothetical protein
MDPIQNAMAMTEQAIDRIPALYRLHQAAELAKWLAALAFVWFMANQLISRWGEQKRVSDFTTRPSARSLPPT